MKKKRRHSKTVFKEYNQEQPLLIPPSLDELIPANHLVRTINNAIDAMNIDALLQRYRGGGCSAYHPRMMLKVLVYAYTQRVYSSRMIAKALRENIHFMWISGNNRPDYRTINRFRGSRLKGVVESVFANVVELLLEKGLVSMENYFVDGTKIESAANRYTFVWKKSTEKNQAKLKDKFRDLLERIESCNEDENRKYGNRDLEELGVGVEISAVEVEEVANRINDEIDESGEVTEESEELEEMIEKDIPRLHKYEEQLALCGNRNSYSKTDTDATFMRMKDDHMLNGQLKPAYNVQIGTENQFILNYSMHQKPTDTTTLIPHMENFKSLHGRMPENLVGDAGYGSEENYSYLQNEKTGNYLKYNYFHFENKRAFRNNLFRKENMPYDEKGDFFLCPSDKKLIFKEIRKKRTDNGYLQNIRIYECEDCRRCRRKSKCHKGKGNRRIEVNRSLDAFRAQARENLTSEKGRELRSLRPVEVESVFGDIKQNRGFRRFLLKGIDKVAVEWGIICIAHNFLKMNAKMA